MLGDIGELEFRPSADRGMTPRIFEFLFARIKAVKCHAECKLMMHYTNICGSSSSYCYMVVPFGYRKRKAGGMKNLNTIASVPF